MVQAHQGQEEIIALRAEVTRLRGKPTDPSTAEYKTIKGKRIPSKDWWMYENEKKQETMTKRGKQWIWCPFHKKWGQHQPKDCKHPANKQKQLQMSMQATATHGSTFGDDESDTA